MSDKKQIRFIVLEGPDGSGKSTIVNRIKRFENVVELNFPKTLPSGTLLRINEEKDFALLFTLFDHLDPAKIYVLDRFILSNIVYDRILRGQDVTNSIQTYCKFMARYDVCEILLTRDKIESNFADDRISINKEQFNAIISEYAAQQDPFHIVHRNNGIISIDSNEYNSAIFKALSFIFKKELE